MQAKYLALLLIALSYTFPAQAKETVFESGPNKVQLLELYTSEGCSSCPPADRWMSRFKDDPALWKEVIPVAFHVDYWDYIGWRDPFATKANSNRQRIYRQQGHIKSVYTPGFVLDGEEWRGWYFKNNLPSSKKADGQLTLKVDGSSLQAAYISDNRPNQLQLNVAVLGAGLSTKVKAGENRGRTLKHDFVVLKHLRVNSGNGNWILDLPEDLKPAERYGLAAWVTARPDQAPLQAAGGWLPGKF